MEDSDKKLVLPDSLRDQALSLNHDKPLAAHQGIDRTKARIKERFQLHTLSADVKNFVRSCETCNRNKKADRYGKCSLTELQTYRCPNGASAYRLHGPVAEDTKRERTHFDDGRSIHQMG
ncbi:hypothetical protein DPMN_016877 [Dreissena polymorpha]|uniref:Integrase zinc-binding domain-containing protein n=1 Tax=Dreissena polymorpha TaxID=45954 RepID=A0A9D4NFE5_DREPO|nr:hypothetical protein DPMN_016877 [Dreissena polymorpha]